MRIPALAAAAALVLLPVSASSAASRPLPGLGGCDFVAVSDPTDPARLVVEVHGHVVAADFAATVPVAVVTLTCDVQVGSDYGHGAPDLATYSGSGVDAAVVAPAILTVPAPGEWEYVTVCSRADVTGLDGETRTYYQNSQNSAWSESPDVTCGGAPQCLSLGPECTWYLALLQESWNIVDPLVCPRLAALAPGVPGVIDVDPTGDTYVAGTFVYDCPPYV
jgi:hypothetical protein